MDQPGFSFRGIRQPTDDEEFSELFVDGARTTADLVVGDVGGGWRVAMGTLGFERGVGSLGMQITFAQQLDDVIAVARATGQLDDPIVRDALARAWLEVRIMRYTVQRSLATLEPGPATSISKLYWSQWFQRFGELALRVRGAAGMVSDDPVVPFDATQQRFLFGRAVTIFAGSSEIQRNILGESVLGLPREPR
jgi:alkylation response protein AidB-like acyl-CoA dehydrogenase